LATHILVEEAGYWWTSTKRRIEASGEAIIWVRFKNEFLKKYFPEDLRNKKEAEFLNLKEGSMSVAEYAAKLRSFRGFVLTSISTSVSMRLETLTLWCIGVVCLMMLGG